MNRVSPATAERVRRAFAQLLSPPQVEKLIGIMLVMLLFNEGQTPADAKTGGSLPADLVAHATVAGEPIGYLVSAEEAMGAFHAPDAAAIENGIDEPLVVYLLDQRDKYGPLGKHREAMYVARRLTDLWLFQEEMVRRGLPMFKLLGGIHEAFKEAIVDRAKRAVVTAREPTLLMIPFEISSSPMVC